MKTNMKKTSWGWQSTWVNNNLYSGSMLIITEGEMTPYIYHKRQDKTIMILQGMAKLTVEENKFQLGASDVYQIRPRMMYRLHALRGDVTVLEAGTKIENDIVIVKK